MHYYDTEPTDDNGTCDECGGPICHQATGPRICDTEPTHDPYSDGFQNGGDPYPATDEQTDHGIIIHP